MESILSIGQLECFGDGHKLLRPRQGGTCASLLTFRFGGLLPSYPTPAYHSHVKNVGKESEQD